MDLSIVVPLFNERDNLTPLHAELARTLAELGRPYEVLFVDDGSDDGSLEVLRTIARTDSRVRVIRLARNSGQTAALACGFARARGEMVVALDADGENDPADIPKLLAALTDGYDLVSGWRTGRWGHAALSRRLPSIAANALISRITGVRLHDYGCTLKAYRGDLARGLRLYGEMHRFIPVLAQQYGARLKQIPVRHHARNAGTTKYTLSRTFRVLLDLITVMFLHSYLTRPMHVLGLGGLISMILGAGTLAVTVWMKSALPGPMAARSTPPSSASC